MNIPRIAVPLPVCLSLCQFSHLSVYLPLSFQSLLASLFVCVSARPVACIFAHLRASLPDLSARVAVLHSCLSSLILSNFAEHLLEYSMAACLSTCLLAFDLSICLSVCAHTCRVWAFSIFAVILSSDMCLKCKT